MLSPLSEGQPCTYRSSLCFTILCLWTNWCSIIFHPYFLRGWFSKVMQSWWKCLQHLWLDSLSFSLSLRLCVFPSWQKCHRVSYLLLILYCLQFHSDIHDSNMNQIAFLLYITTPMFRYMQYTIYGGYFLDIRCSEVFCLFFVVS